MEYQDLCNGISRHYRQMDFQIPETVVRSMADEFVLTEEKLNLSEFGYLVRENKTRDVEFLLRSGQDVNEKMYQGRNALSFAVEAGLKDMAALLIHHGINVNVKESNGFTPLHTACFCRHKDIVRLLLSKGAEIHGNSMMGTPILTACFIPSPSKIRDPSDIVKILLDHGANVNDVSEHGETALILAVRDNNLRLVKLLIEAKADVNVFVPIPNYNDGKVPLVSVALGKRYFEIVKCILAVDTLDVKIKEKNLRSPLHIACALGNLEIVKLMVERNFNINEITVSLKTPLLLALDSGHFRVAEYLLEQDKINVDLPHPFKRVPLDAAIEVGDRLPSTQKKLKQKVINTIIDKTKDLNAEWPRKPTPMAQAVAVGDQATIKYLIQKGAKVNLSDNQRKTNAIDHLVRSMCPSVSNSGLMYSTDSFTHSPLQIANQRKNNIETVNLLLENGAMVNDGTPDIRPLTSAIEAGDFKMVKELLNHGAELDKEAVTKNQAVAKSSSNEAELTERKKINDLLRLSLKLMKNVRTNNYQEVKENIENGACVNVSNEKYGSPLIYASWKGYEDIVDLLLQNGANVNFKSATGFTSLHMACRFNNDCNIVAKLLLRGAYYNMIDGKNNNSPLQYAHAGKNEATAKLLHLIDSMFEDVRKGHLEVSDKSVLKVMRNVKNDEGKTLIDVARAGKFSNGLLDRLLKMLQESEDK